MVLPWAGFNPTQAYAWVLLTAVAINIECVR
jgi:hypothetical protein